MNRFEKALLKRNFKKIAVWYLILAAATGLICAGTVGYIYRERLNFAWQYSRLEETKDSAALKSAADKTASASADVIDVLILDENNIVTYSAKNSEFAVGKMELVRAETEKKYLISDSHPNAAFRYVKSEEFLLKSIISKDFGKIRSEYDDESAFENSLSSKSIYMLSRVGIRGGNGSIYVITVPTSVPGGMAAVKVTAATAMLFFCAYWVLIALWMYRDAAAVGLSPMYWGLIGLLTNVVGLIVYKIYKHSLAVCPSCGTAQNADHLYCSVCGTQLGIRCGNCGCKVGAKDIFCHRCGNKVE